MYIVSLESRVLVDIGKKGILVTPVRIVRHHTFGCDVNTFTLSRHFYRAIVFEPRTEYTSSMKAQPTIFEPSPMDLDPDLQDSDDTPPSPILPPSPVVPGSQIIETVEQIQNRRELFTKSIGVRDKAKLKILENKYCRSPSRIPKDIITSSILACEGNLTNAAVMLGVSYLKLSRMVDGSRDLIQLCVKAREQIVDMAEEVLKDHLRASDLKAATFALSTLGKSRGYVPRTDHYSEVNKTVSVTAVDLTKLTTEDLRQLRRIREDVTVIEGEVVEDQGDE